MSASRRRGDQGDKLTVIIICRTAVEGNTYQYQPAVFVEDTDPSDRKSKDPYLASTMRLRCTKVLSNGFPNIHAAKDFAIRGFQKSLGLPREHVFLGAYDWRGPLSPGSVMRIPDWRKPGSGVTTFFEAMQSTGGC